MIVNAYNGTRRVCDKIELSMDGSRLILDEGPTMKVSWVTSITEGRTENKLLRKALTWIMADCKDFEDYAVLLKRIGFTKEEAYDELNGWGIPEEELSRILSDNYEEV